jgi:hypothetical protein
MNHPSSCSSWWFVDLDRRMTTRSDPGVSPLGPGRHRNPATTAPTPLGCVRPRPRYHVERRLRPGPAKGCQRGNTLRRDRYPICGCCCGTLFRLLGLSLGGPGLPPPLWLNLRTDIGRTGFRSRRRRRGWLHRSRPGLGLPGLGRRCGCCGCGRICLCRRPVDRFIDLIDLSDGCGRGRCWCRVG